MGTAGETNVKAAETELERDWRTVSGFLKDHPELIRQDEGLLADLGLRPLDNVYDFGPAALARARQDVEREAEAREWLQAMAESNFAAQTQAQSAVIDVIEASDNTDLAVRVDDIAHLGFCLAAGVLGVEGPAPEGWISFTPRFIDELVGAGQTIRMGPSPYVHAMFPIIRDEVRSLALARLTLWEGRPGVLAFASAEPETFEPDMGGELIDFIARVVERTAVRWPAP